MATRLVERLQAVLAETVPDGVTVLVTVTAPIRLPAKTTTGIEEKVRTLLTRKATHDEEAVIHGNRVRIRFFTDPSKRAPSVLGFVHNPDSEPVAVLNLACQMLTA